MAKVTVPRALVVDDNDAVLASTCLLLEHFGFAVREAPDASFALRVLEAEHFDLILSDISMPGDLNGIDLARRIRDQQPSTRIVLMTGYSELVNQAVADFTVLAKPFSPAELRRALDSALPPH